jgi:hypothetical protein
MRDKKSDKKPGHVLTAARLENLQKTPQKITSHTWVNVTKYISLIYN